MKILVANIGSTSFKFRLYELTGRAEKALASGAAERIGREGGTIGLILGSAEGQAEARDFADHGQAVRHVLDRLVAAGVLSETQPLDAVAFKAVMGGDCPPVALVDDKLLERMEYFSPVAPAHNPPYVAAMRMFGRALPGTPLIAAFEPGFHKTIPPRRRYYAVPPQWAEQYGIKRYGFHGASHRYIATRTGELMPDARRIISCHLGGSSSICAIRDGESVACSLGLSPQSGLPQSNRAGEFDVFALPLLHRAAGLDTQAVLDVLGSGSGLAALSGTSGDIRDITAAAGRGDGPARLAMDVFITAVRDFVGAYLLELGGADAIVFTGGIGQHNPQVRRGACQRLGFLGIRLSDARNEATTCEGRIDTEDSATAIWVIPTNEELIVARQAAKLLAEHRGEKQSNTNA